MNFVDIYQKYWKNGYTLTDLSLSGIDREVFRSLFNPVAEVFRKYPAGDVHLYIPGVGQVQGMQPGNYFDSAGTTLASVDGSVGLVLDAAGSVGAELAPPIDATWTRDATVSVSGNAFVYANTPAANNGAYKAVQLTTGKTYRVTLTVSGYVSGSISAWLGNQQTGASNAMLQANGTLSFIVSPTAAYNGYFLVGTNVGTTSATVILASIKEVTGNHAIQSTPGYKPTERRGIVNVQPYSNDLTVAGWNATNLTKAAGSLTRISTGSSAYCISPAIATPIPVGSKFTVAVKAKAKSTGGRLGVRGSAPYPNRSDGVFDLNTGTVVGYGNGGGFTGTTATIAGPDSSGYYMCAVSGTVGTAPLDTVITGPTDSSLGISGWEASSLVLSDVYVAASGIFTGTLTAQQILDAGGIPITTTAPASSQTGLNCLEFDGLDDRLAFSKPLFQMADDHCVVVGALAPANQAGYRSVVNPSYSDSTNYAAQILIEGGTGKVYVEWKGGGNVDALASPSSVIGTPFVFDVRKVGNTKYAALNGVDLGTRGAVTSATQATLANIGTETNNIPMKGNTYAVLTIKGTVSPTDLLVLRKFIGSLSGVTL